MGSLGGARLTLKVRKQTDLQLNETNDALHQRLLELSILNFIAQTLTTVTDIKTALATVIRIVSRLFNANCAALNIFDPVSNDVYVISAHEIQKADVTQCLFKARHVQEYLFVPLQARNEVIGLLTLAMDRPEQEFSLAEEYLVTTIAGQIAGAIRIVQLFEQERRQAQLAESLRQVATALNSSLDRTTILNTIFEQLRQVLPYDGATISLVQSDELVFVQTIGRTIWQVNDRLPLKGDNVIVQVLRQRQVVILTDATEAEGWPIWYRPNEVGSWMGGPLGVGPTVFGMLTVRQSQVGAYSPKDAKILQTFANQAALAIENGRLYEQAQSVAIDAERQRLARELHDSVTQSLYSLTLLTNGWANTAQQGKSDVPQMIQQFKKLEEISLQGLKEMRLLLHQLRPPILEEMGLVGALQQRLDAVEHRVNVKTRLLAYGEVDELPVDLQEQLFAIAQEALTNILRHAEATEVIVLLRREDMRLTMAITDNGIGFDPAEPSFGFGLVSIRERTRAIGGQVEITTVPQQGTTVMVTVVLSRN